ncbi:MAG: GFA family protein [Alphaproteobacteria bacterium]|nr:GFA family protein [Alphaproteobacteria bacterium]
MGERTGRCLCGAVAFKATPKETDGEVHVDACHCGMCRRAIGGPLLGVTLVGPPVIEDERQLSVYSSSAWAERAFCRTCGSNLFYRFKDGSMHTVHAGALDDLSDAVFAVEIFVDDKPGFYEFSGDRTRMTGAEVMSAFVGGEKA